MNAILEAVEALAGKLRITSLAGQGLKVHMEVPWPKDEPMPLRLDRAV